MPLHDNWVGRTLATPVIDARGAVLLHAHVVLTDRHLTTLRARGIETLDLQPETLDLQPEAVAVCAPVPSRDAAQAAIEAALDDRFRQSNRDHPAIATLFALCQQHARDRR